MSGEDDARLRAPPFLLVDSVSFQRLDSEYRLFSSGQRPIGHQFLFMDFNPCGHKLQLCRRKRTGKQLAVWNANNSFLSLILNMNVRFPVPSTIVKEHHNHDSIKHGYYWHSKPPLADLLVNEPSCLRYPAATREYGTVFPSCRTGMCYHTSLVSHSVTSNQENPFSDGMAMSSCFQPQRGPASPSFAAFVVRGSIQDPE